MAARVCSLTQAFVFTCYASLVPEKPFICSIFITNGNCHLTCSLLRLILTGIATSLQLSSRTHFRSRIVSLRL
jgi:hypothetical protein